MSTILKALKKLEQESDSQALGRQTAEPVFNTRQVVRRTAMYTWLSSVGIRWAVAVLVIIFIGGAAFYFYSRPQLQTAFNAPRRSQPPAQTHSIDKAKPAAIASQTPEQTKVSEPPATRKSIPVAPINQAAPRIGPANTTSMPSAPKRAVQSPLASAPQTNRTVPNTPIAPQARRPGPQVEPKPTKAAAPPPAASARPAKQKSTPNVKAQRLTDGRLKVQAIAWSPDAQERMAVINNRIVREGHTVDGFTVLVIGKDDVVVKEGDRNWRVVFGRP